MPKDGYITVKEAAKIIGLSERSVRLRLKEKLLEGYEEDTPRGKVWYVSQKSAQASKRIRKPKVLKSVKSGE